MGARRDYMRRTVGSLPGQYGGFIDRVSPFSGNGKPRTEIEGGRAARTRNFSIVPGAPVQLTTENGSRKRLTFFNGGDASEPVRDLLRFEFGNKPTARSQKLRPDLAKIYERGCPTGALWVQAFDGSAAFPIVVTVEEIAGL